MSDGARLVIQLSVATTMVWLVAMVALDDFMLRVGFYTKARFDLRRRLNAVVTYIIGWATLFVAGRYHFADWMLLIILFTALLLISGLILRLVVWGMDILCERVLCD